MQEKREDKLWQNTYLRSNIEYGTDFLIVNEKNWQLFEEKYSYL
jgi:hypothetical protein